MKLTKSMKLILIFSMVILFLSGIFTGCSPRNEAAAGTNPIPKRVVSLMSSFTETWLLAGGKDTLIGVTRDAITDRKLDVVEDVTIVGTYKEPNTEIILSLSPDFVILSADLESHQKLAETLKASNIPHELYRVEQFEDYLSLLNAFTDMTGEKELYDKNGLMVQDEINAILDKVTAANISPSPSVLFLRAFSGGARVMSNDEMVGRMLQELEADNIAAKYPSLLSELSMEVILTEDPDYILVTTMGDEASALEALRDGIEQDPGWNSLTAVTNNRYIILPKELFHYKPNAKWGESYEYLAKIIYPELFR